MNKQQLNIFFDHAGIARSNEPATIRLLKKHLLLELKSLPGAMLLIDGRTYSKDDLLRFFNELSDSSAGGFDPKGLLMAFPSLRAILHPGEITTYRGFPEAAAGHPDFEQFREQEVVPLLRAYTDVVEAALKKDELEKVAALLVFLRLFNEGQQFEVSSKVKLLLRNKLALIRPLHYNEDHTAYFVDTNYYRILKVAAANDESFLVEQLTVMNEKGSKHASLETTILMMSFQLELPFPQDYLETIRKHLGILQKELDRRPPKTDLVTSCLVYIGIMAVIVISMIIYENFSNPAPPKPIPEYKDLLPQGRPEAMPDTINLHQWQSPE